MTNFQFSETITFLVRLWPVWSGGRLAWRASLTRLPQNEQQGFASLDEMIRFITNLVQSSSPRQDDLHDSPMKGSA